MYAFSLVERVCHNCNNVWFITGGLDVSSVTYVCFISGSWVCHNCNICMHSNCWCRYVICINTLDSTTGLTRVTTTVQYSLYINLLMKVVAFWDPAGHGGHYYLLLMQDGRWCDPVSDTFIGLLMVGVVEGDGQLLLGWSVLEIKVVVVYLIYRLCKTGIWLRFKRDMVQLHVKHGKHALFCFSKLKLKKSKAFHMKKPKGVFTNDKWPHPVLGHISPPYNPTSTYGTIFVSFTTLTLSSFLHFLQNK